MKKILLSAVLLVAMIAFKQPLFAQAMQLVFTTTGASQSISLPLYGTVNCTVNWGDGTSNNTYTTTGFKSHTFASAGTYTVSITGTLTRFGNGTSPGAGWGYLTSVTSFGNIGLTSLYGAFNNADNLTSVPATLPAAITDLSYCFYDVNTKSTFTNLDSWDVSHVTNMSCMFYGGTAFNQNIGSWNVSSVINMSGMFYGGSAFNQNISTWNVSSVTNMSIMFSNATAFNQNIGGWNVAKVTNMNNMFQYVTLTTANYDALLAGWNALELWNNVTFNAGNSKYSPTGGAAKEGILIADIWTISDGGISCTDCMKLQITTPAAFNSIALPLYGTVNCFVDWGDNKINSYSTTGDKSHTFTSAGSYTVNISGSLTQFGKGINAWSGSGYLAQVTSLGTLGLTSLSGAFNNADNLTTVPTALPATITDLSYCFYAINTKASFTNLDLWDVSHVTNMSYLFSGTSTFNQNIGSWNVGNVTNMNGMFYSAAVFNQNIGSWDVSNVTNMSNTFRNAYDFNQNIGNWDVGSVTDMSYMFVNAYDFNQDIGGWDVSQVNNMGSMLSTARTFNQDIGGWDVSNVTNMQAMFSRADVFNQDIGNWNVSNVTNMKQMFWRAWPFNQDISTKIVNEGQANEYTAWDVSNVTDMSEMFSGLMAFNQDIGNWNVSNVTNMSYMFEQASVFNQDISTKTVNEGLANEYIAWDVSHVTNMRQMFRGPSTFNRDISNWDVGGVTNMYGMFNSANSFNQNIGIWNVSNVTDMEIMFYNATAFNQNIGNWDIGTVTAMNDMFTGATLSTANYNALLNGWNALELSNDVTFSGGNSKYSAAASAARASIISTDSWTITDGGMANELIWDGSESSSWNEAGNWDGNILPTASDDVIITTDGNDPVIAHGIGATCREVIVNTGATLTINSGGSLISTGSITNNGSINILKDISQSAWHLTSIPVTTATANSFLGDYLQSWSESSHTWTDIADENTTLQPLLGYGLWATPSKAATTYTFTGTPNTGNMSRSLSFTEYSTDPLAYEGANLLGNPYPSAIDWSMLDDTYGAVYFWNSTTGSYSSWNNNSGVNGGVQYIPPMQGFFIIAQANGTFSINNTHRTHSGATTYLKNNETPENFIRLVAASQNFSDELLVRFNDETTSDFDLQYDAYKFPSGTAGLSELYSYAADKKLSIDARPECEVVQLGFSNSESGTYSIGVNQVNGFANTILEDTKTKTFTDLLKGVYSFNWTAGEYDQRFKLHFNTILSKADQKDVIANIYSYHKTAYINLKNSVKGDIFIYNVAGQLVTTKLSAKGMNEIGLRNTGNYIVKIVSDRTTQVKKIFIR